MTASPVVAAVPGGDAVSDSMAGGMAEALELLLSPQGASDARWGVRSAVLLDRRIDDDQAQQWVEEELRVLEAVEVVKAWADAVGLAALRRLREAVGEQVRAVDDLSGPAGRGMPPHVLRAESDTAAVDEVVLATGLPQREVSRRLVSDSEVDAASAAAHAADPFDDPPPY